MGDAAREDGGGTVAEGLSLGVGRGARKENRESGGIFDPATERYKDHKIGIDVKSLHLDRGSDAGVLGSEGQVSRLQVRRRVGKMVY